MQIIVDRMKNLSWGMDSLCWSALVVSNSSTMVPLSQIVYSCKGQIDSRAVNSDCVAVVLCDSRKRYVVRSLREYLRLSEKPETEFLYLVFNDRDAARLFWAYAQSKTYSLFVGHLQSRRLSVANAKAEYLNGLVPDPKSIRLSCILSNVVCDYERFEYLIRRSEFDQRRCMAERLGLSMDLDPTVLKNKRPLERHVHHVVGFRWDAGFLDSEEMVLRRWFASSVFGYKTVRLRELVDSLNVDNRIPVKTKFGRRRGMELLVLGERNCFRLGSNVIKLIKDVDARYVCLFLNSGILDAEIKNQSVNGNMEFSSLLSMLIVVPPLLTQTEIINEMAAQKRESELSRVEESRLKDEVAEMIDSVYLCKEDDANV